MIHPIQPGEPGPGEERGSGPPSGRARQPGARQPGSRPRPRQPGARSAGSTGPVPGGKPTADTGQASPSPAADAGAGLDAGWAGRREPAPGYPRAAARGRAAAPAGSRHLQLTGRGALVAMFLLFFLSLLISEGLGWAWVAGLAFVAGSGAAARYTNPLDLLPVAVTPPLLFMCALLLTRVLTGGGHLLVSVAEGSLLTLAAVAPWLFAGVAVNLIIGFFRGLAGCIRDLRQDLRGTRPGFPGEAPAQRAQSRRATPQ